MFANKSRYTIATAGTTKTLETLYRRDVNSSRDASSSREFGHSKDSSYVYRGQNNSSSRTHSSTWRSGTSGDGNNKTPKLVETRLEEKLITRGRPATAEISQQLIPQQQPGTKRQ